MISQFRQIVSSKGKALVIAALLFAGLWSSSVFAHPKEEQQREYFEVSLMTFVMLGKDALSDDLLDQMRGQGFSRALTPEIPRIGIILWDEGSVRKGGSNGKNSRQSTLTTTYLSVEDQ